MSHENEFYTFLRHNQQQHLFSQTAGQDKESKL